jgi:hypothetical protein
LDWQLPLQSVPITIDVVGSTPAQSKVYNIMNEVERKLAGILIQNHHGDNNITNILLVGETS